MALTSTYRTFAVETFFKTDDSVIDTQIFRAHFMLRQNYAVLDRIFNPLLHRFSIWNRIIPI